MKKTIIITIITLSFFLITCKKSDSQKTGNLEFTANGEGFVANGFSDKTGWKISFSKVLVNLDNVKVISKDDNNTVTLPGQHLIDFKSSNDAVVKVGKVKKAAAKEYRNLTWSVKRLKSGKFKGYSMVLIGEAQKSGKKINFTIKINEEIKWNAKEGYSGEKIKGIVKKGKTGEVEMTFHWDHVFGDAGAKSDSHINKGAVGFDYFLKFVKNGKIDVDQKTLKAKTDGKKYSMFIKSLHSLGHSGEGHADVLYSSTKL